MQMQILQKNAPHRNLIAIPTRTCKEIHSGNTAQGFRSYSAGSPGRDGLSHIKTIAWNWSQSANSARTAKRSAIVILETSSFKCFCWEWSAANLALLSQQIKKANGLPRHRSPVSLVCLSHLHTPCSPQYSIASLGHHRQCADSRCIL